MILYGTEMYSFAVSKEHIFCVLGSKVIWNHLNQERENVRNFLVCTACLIQLRWSCQEGWGYWKM